MKLRLYFIILTEYRQLGSVYRKNSRKRTLRKLKKKKKSSESYKRRKKSKY